MKKSLSLVLAIVMVAAIMVSAIPFGAFAEEAAAPATVCRLGSLECETLDVALMFASMAMEDVTITLTADITVATIVISNVNVNEATGKPVKVTLDGNGHTVTSNTGNVFRLGNNGAAPTATNNIVVKDLVLEYSGVGSCVQVYTGGDFLLEDVFFNCTAPITWTVFNANMNNNGKDNPANITLNNVDMVQPAYGGNGKSGDTSFIRTGNSDSNFIGPVIYYTLKDCDFRVTEAQWSADHHLAASGVHVTQANGHFVLENCYVEALYRTVNITSGVEGKVAEGDMLVKANNCKFVNLTGEDGTALKHGYKDSKAEVLEPAEKTSIVVYTPKYADIKGEYVAPVGEAQFIAEGEAAVDCATLAEALEKAAASTKNCTVKLNKDITTDAVLQLATAADSVVLTFDGNDKTLTLSAGNAIKVGVAGLAAKINLKNFDINYSTGAGSIIQVYANGEVNIADVKINNTAKLNWCAVNALNNAGTELTMTIDDCVFVSEAEGNNANVGVIRTGNGGNTVALTITNTDVVVVGNGGEKPATALNVTSELATVVVDDCSFTATANNAIVVSKDITTKVAVTNSVLKVNEGVEITNKADLVDLAIGCVVVVGGVASDVTEPVVTEPVVETTEPVVDTTEAPAVETTPAPVVTTPAATDAPTTTTGGGCGGIAVAAQLVALICAAAAVVIIKKK